MSDVTDDPVATASQHEHELAALELTEHPTVKAAYRSVAETWLGREKASDAMRDCFDEAFDEVMFSAAVWSSNQDKLRPEGHLHHPARAPGRGPRDPRLTLGHRQPRQRLPGDPDLRRRALRDPRPGRRAPDDRELLHAVGRQHGHRGGAQRPHLDVDADGSFVITVDADPAGGRPNHVQSTPEAHEFYIRDVLLDWAATTPISSRCNASARRRRLPAAHRSTSRPRPPRR